MEKLINFRADVAKQSQADTEEYFKNLKSDNVSSSLQQVKQSAGQAVMKKNGTTPILIVKNTMGNISKNNVFYTRK